MIVKRHEKVKKDLESSVKLTANDYALKAQKRSKIEK